MVPAQLPEHTLRRGEIFYFRRAIPRSLWSRFGCREIKVSLRTRDPFAANKIHKIPVQLSAIAYQYKVGDTENVYVLGPFIGKISITVPVAGRETREKIKHSLVTMAGDPDEPQFEFASVVKTNYAHAINCTPPGANDKILIQVKPKKKTMTSFLRFEFNPSKIGAKALAKFKELLFELSYTEFSWADVIKLGRVTRLDVAIDMINAPTSDLLMISHVPGKSHVYFGLGGNVETSYVGLKKPVKASDQKIYNKLQEETDKKINPGYGGVFHTRVEMGQSAGEHRLALLSERRSDSSKTPLSREDGGTRFRTLAARHLFG